MTLMKSFNSEFRLSRVIVVEKLLPSFCKTERSGGSFVIEQFNPCSCIALFKIQRLKISHCLESVRKARPKSIWRGLVELFGR